MPKCTPQTYIENDEIYWVCPNNMGPRTPRKYSTTKKCWKHACPGISSLAGYFCLFPTCEKIKMPDSKYCSSNCRKKMSKYNLKNKKK